MYLQHRGMYKQEDNDLEKKEHTILQFIFSIFRDVIKQQA